MAVRMPRMNCHRHRRRVARYPRLGVWVAGLLGALLLAVPVTGTASGTDGDDPRWCRACHTQDRFGGGGFGGSVHADMTCRDCHQGYHFNPHERVEEASSDAITALTKAGASQPIALAACGDCHDNEEPGRFSHGLRDERDPAALPYCVDCHGDPHVIQAAETVPKLERRLAMNDRCLACHSDPEKMDGAITTDISGWYEHSMHARKMHLGAANTPGCFDCHGTHETRNMQESGAEACGKCHEGANASFAALGGHTPITSDAAPIGFFTQKFFAWLTFLTILLLSLHVLLDLFATIRAARASGDKGKGEGKGKQHARAPAVASGEAATTVDPDEHVQRFDLHQRAQHLIMIVSFITLVLTGWPLSAHKIPASEGLLAFFGGLEMAALIHRIAAIGLVITSVYHLAYLTLIFVRRGRQARLSMLPTPKDLKDAIGNVLYFFGLRKERPRFPRYSYFEKFDYWAVFWGVFIMVGSGFVRWFPVATTEYLPSWVYEIAFFAHADEALLAAMAIFVWHFYNVHLRPAVFPMSWVFLTGRMTMAELEHEHGAEYDEIVAKRGEVSGSSEQPSEADAQAKPSAAESSEGADSDDESEVAATDAPKHQAASNGRKASAKAAAERKRGEGLAEIPDLALDELSDAETSSDEDDVAEESADAVQDPDAEVEDEQRSAS